MTWSSYFDVVIRPEFLFCLLPFEAHQIHGRIKPKNRLSTLCHIVSCHVAATWVRPKHKTWTRHDTRTFWRSVPSALVRQEDTAQTIMHHRNLPVPRAQKPAVGGDLSKVQTIQVYPVTREEEVPPRRRALDIV